MPSPKEKRASIRGLFSLFSKYQQSPRSTVEDSSSSIHHTAQKIVDEPKQQTNAPTKSTMEEFDDLLKDMNQMGEVCLGCSMIIMEQEKDMSVLAFNRRWHRSCIRCRLCKQEFTDPSQTIHEGSDGWPYCDADFKKEFPPCSKCFKQILQKADKIEALGKFWHSDW